MAFNLSSQPYTWTFRRVMWATLILVFVALGFWLLYRFNQVLFILFIAIVIGTVIRPAVTWLHRRGLQRSAGVILVYLVLLALRRLRQRCLSPPEATATGCGQRQAVATPNVIQRKVQKSPQAPALCHMKPVVCADDRATSFCYAIRWQ